MYERTIASVPSQNFITKQIGTRSKILIHHPTKLCHHHVISLTNYIPKKFMNRLDMDGYGQNKHTFIAQK